MVVVTNRIPVSQGHEIDFEDRFKRRVHLVEDAERRRLVAEDRQQERHRGQRLLAARKEGERAQLLPRGPRGDLDAGLQHVGLVLQHDVRLAAAEKAAKPA
mgnify:CR=1 FL=1